MRCARSRRSALPIATSCATTFLLTLAKTQDEKRALGDCFDLFFSRPEPAQEKKQDDTSDECESTAPMRNSECRRIPSRRSDADSSDAGGGDHSS